MDDDFYQLGYYIPYDDSQILEFFRGLPSLDQVNESGLVLTEEQHKKLLRGSEIKLGSRWVYLTQIIFKNGEH